MLCVFVVACTLARTTGERMRYAYVMRGTQKKHVLHLLPSLFFELERSLDGSLLFNTLSRACIFWTLYKLQQGAFGSETSEWWSGVVCVYLDRCQKFN